MVIAICIVLLISSVVGKFTESSGLFEITNEISPYLTIVLFVMLVVLISKNVRRK